MRGLQDEEQKSATSLRSRMEEEDETLRQNHQAQMNALGETQQAQLDELRASHQKALDEQELQDRKRSEELLVTQSKELAALLGLEQTDIVDVLRAQICEHRNMRADHQLKQHELLATHCAALIGLTKQQQQQLADDLHARHAMQISICDKDKKHTIDKNALLKSHEADNESLKQQQETMSQRVDQACREKEEKLVQLQNDQLQTDANYAQKQLDSVQEKLQMEHDRTLRFVTETLRGNTIADTTVELPEFVMPTLSDIIPNYTNSDQGMAPPVARAPSAPKESGVQSPGTGSLRRPPSSMGSSRSHSSPPSDDEDDVPPPPPPA